jgi:hypothetical protein
VRFIDNQQVPRKLCLWTTTCRVRCTASSEELLQNIRLPKVIVGSNDARVGSPRIGIKADSPLERMGFCPVDEIKVESKLGLHFPLPLLTERGRGQNQNAAHSTTDQKFSQNQASFDRFSEANIVGYQQRDPRHLQCLEKWDQLEVIHLHRAEEWRRDRHFGGPTRTVRMQKRA